MFQSAYQDGDCVEVFSPAGKNPGSEWRSSGKIVRAYEKGVKGYVLTVSGGATSKMQLPKAPKGLLGLRQRHLVLQVLTAASQDKPFSLELGLKDSGGTRRRLVLSSSFKALHCTPLHAQVPLVGLDRHRGTWANLSIDLAGLTAVCFRADAFTSLELISIGPTCRLRKIFTMKDGLDDWEQEEREGQDEPMDGGTASGPNDGGGCEPASVAPVPVRMAFPAGVVPAPRNWAISLSTLRRLASRDVPPPSPSTRASAGRTRRSRPAQSPSQSSFTRGPSSLSSATASLCVQGEVRSVRSNRGGASAEKGTAPGKPSSSSSSRASPTGLLPRQRSASSRGSISSASTRAPATPSPLATPARNGSNTPGRRGPRPPSSSSGILESSTPGGRIARDGVGVGLAGREGGGTTPSGRRSGNAGTPSFRRTLPRAEAVTPSSAGRSVRSAAEGNYGEIEGVEGLEGSGRRGLLPARRRVAEAYLSGGITKEIGQTRVADGGGGGASGRGGRMNRAPAEEWRVAGGWGEGNDGHAPAWSFLGGNENDGFSSDDASRMATPQPKRSDSVESPPGWSQTELATTAPASSCGRSALASITDGDARGATSGLEGDDPGGGRVAAERSPSTPQASHEALPADIDVSWREGRHDDDGAAAASSKRFSSTVRLRSPGARNDAKRASSRASPPSYAIPSSTAAGVPTALGTSGHSSRAEATLERKEDDARAKTPSAATRLFASTFSTLEEGYQDARRSPAAALDGGASRTGGRSPTSARVDVLQNLLAPAETCEQGLTRPRVGIVASAVAIESTGDEAVIAKTSMAPGAEEEGGGVCGVVECDEIVETAERLLGRSIENGSPNTDTVGRFVDAIARRESSHPGLSNEHQSHHSAEATERPKTPETKGTDLRPTRPRARSGVDASVSALDRGPGGKASPLGPKEEFDAMEIIQFDDVEGLSRPSSYSARNEDRWDDQKAFPRPAMGKRSDELEELERKEIALLDLEESSHSEFGSVDLSQSPEDRVPFTGNYSAARASAASEKIRTDSSTTAKILGGSKISGHGTPNRRTEPHFGSLDYRQRASVGDVSNDGDTDSVVFGSRASTASAAPGEGTVEEEPGARAGSPVEGGEGVAKREARDRGGGVEHDSERGNSELYFDPVLNCYYDRVADKYYGLR